MVKILLISDSHGEIRYVNQLIEQNYDYVFYMGDGLKDLGTYTNLQNVHYVRGNCDIFAHNEKITETLFIRGNKILITHGHEFKVKYGTEVLEEFAKQKGYNLVCFGHTHNATIIEKDGIMYINPGSLCAGKYAELEISKDGNINGKLLTL